MTQNILKFDSPATGKVFAALKPADTVNYLLCSYNQERVIKKIEITNNSDKFLSGLMVQISTVPAFAQKQTFTVDVPARRTVTVTDRDLIPDITYLKKLDEKVPCVINLAVMQGEEELFSDSYPITVQPLDQWPGYSKDPGLLVCFVAPNTPWVSRILGRVSEILQDTTNNGSRSAYYWNDPNRVLQTVKAACTAIFEVGLVYTPMQSSYEHSGQRVRLQDKVMEEKNGNCVELSALFCAVMEQLGLNPFLVGVQGHMYMGVWMEDATFGDIVTTDVAALKMLLTQNKLKLMECTLCIQGASFENCTRRAEEELTTFEYCIDVKKGRSAGYTPIPLDIEMGTVTVEQEETAETEQEEKPPVPELEFEMPEDATPGDIRYARWRHENMDLTNRNPMLNLKSGNVLMLYAADFEFEKEIMELCPCPQDWKCSRELTFAGLSLDGSQRKEAQMAASQKKLLTPYREKQLEASAASIEKVIQAHRDKCAVYLYSGLLCYHLPDKKSESLYAPLLIYPANLGKALGRSGYTLQLDGEPEINEVLVEKLRRYCDVDLSRLYDADLGQEGISAKVMGFVSQAISHTDWTVLSAVGVTAFTVPAYDLYTELTNHRPAIEKHPVVESLLSSQLVSDLAEDWKEDGLWEEERPLLLTAALDPSQKQAVKAAAQGKSFVLDGGPGTGKSITIDAIIEDSITHDKRVLFVSEKDTAIEAVQGHLKKHGLQPYCLHLTTDKQAGEYIAQQLQQVVDLQNCSDYDTDYQRQQIKTEAVRSAFQGYYDVLFAKQPCGMTLHELADRFAAYENAQGFHRGALAEGVVLNDRERLEAQEDLLRQIGDVAQQIHPQEHPLSSISMTGYTPEKELELRRGLVDRHRALTTFAEVAKKFSKATGRSMPQSKEGYRELGGLALQVMAWQQYPHDFLGMAVEDYFQQLLKIADCYQQADRVYRQLKNWTPEFFNTDAASALVNLQSAEAKRIGRKQALAEILEEFKPYSKYNMTKDTLKAALKQLQEYQLLLSEGEEKMDAYGRSLPVEDWWTRDWNQFRNLIHRAQNSWDALSAEVPEDSLYLLVQQPELAKEYAALYETAMEESVWAEADEAGEHWIEEQQSQIEGLLENLGHLKDWTVWNDLREKAAALDISVVTDAYMAGYPGEKIEKGYYKTLYKTLIAHIVESSPATRNYSGVKFRAMNRDLQRRNKHLLERSEEEARKRLGSNNLMEAATRNSDLSILLKWLKQPSRMPVRELFGRIPGLIFALCPCIIASNDAVAKYLPFARNSFDMVIFDEASQMTTARSVSVLARAGQVIVCGDPNQMPPTRFFQRAAEQGDDPELMDMENILDDLITLGMPRIQLKYHYRSRHEDLFAFNNATFYQGRLVTLPGVYDVTSHVKLIRVNGIYEIGRRRNAAEADAIVEELRSRSRMAEQKDKSVLILTFNATQQAEIEARVAAACRDDAELSQWLYSRSEPLLIQNLENVQGDERDVVMLSVTYGPDADGKVSLNFGPLNQTGGFRRLNVATTRAREEMLVFSSMGSEDISEKRTGARGVLALRDFLRYAESGYLPVDMVSETEGYKENRIVRRITTALEAEGYRIKTGVGHSAMQVDIAIVDPRDPSHYLLGILLDVPSDLDRDALAFQLEDCGWEIMQIHDLDYLGHSELAVSAVLERLKDLAA